MKSQITFFPTSFPVFAREWLDLTRPYLEVFLKMRSAFDVTRNQPKHQRMVQRYKKQREMLEQIQAESEDCSRELRALSFLREMVDASVHLGACPPTMLSIVAMVLIEANAALRDAMSDAEAGTANAAYDDEAERMQGTFLRAMDVSRRRGIMKPQARICCDWLETWIHRADGRQLLGMSASFSDTTIVDAIFKQGVASTVISVERVDALTRRLAVIQGEHRRLRKAYDEINDRLARTGGRILAPYAALATSDSAWGILPVLVDVMAKSIASALRPPDEVKPAHMMFLQRQWATLLEAACIDPMFWYIGLTSLLRSSGATFGYGLKKWAVELIAWMLRHPSRLREVTVPDEGMRTRSLLNKWIAPIVKGFGGNEGVAAKMLELGTGRSDHGLFVLSSHLATASEQPDEAIGYRNQNHQRTAEFLWAQVIGPAHAEILPWLADGAQASSGIFASPDAEATAKQETLEPTEGTPVALPEADDRTNGGKLETWYYVPNPASAILAMAPVELRAEGREAVFSDFLLKQRVNLLIKPTSILKALDYFRNMPPMLRAVTPYDDLGNHRWHKLKRGRMRIYVRMESDGRMLFSLIFRRDWRAELVSFAHRAA